MLIYNNNSTYFLLTFITFILHAHEESILKSVKLLISLYWVMHYGEENYRRELDGYVQSRTQSWNVQK